MATQYDNAIQQLYVAYFNRPADASGITFWANAMANGVTTAQISAAFAASAEYQTEYSQTTYTGVVTQVYDNLFGRAPDATGLAFWVKALNDKTLTIDNVVDFIARGAQGTDAAAIAAKVKVATAFTNALDTDAEKAGYNGTEANDAAKALLSTIKTDAQATAAIVPATLDASVAAVIKAGTPFTLEAGLASLAAAEKAITDFLADVEIVDENGDEIEDVDADAIEANVGMADEMVGELITVGTYAGARDSVKVALIAEQQAQNAEDLEEANETLADARAEVAKVSGLGNAIAAATSAEEAVGEAEEAAATADAALAGALGSFRSLNSAKGTITVVDGTIVLAPTPTTETPAPAPVTLAAIDEEDGVWVVDEDVTASNYPGLAAVITAGNAQLVAAAEVSEAEDNLLFAQIEVEYRDRDATGTAALRALVTDGFLGDVTVPSSGTPTIANLRDQLAALQGEGDADAIQDYKDALQNFLDVNTSNLADDVAEADEAINGDEGVQARIDALADAVEYLEAAKALETELASLIEARDAALADFEDNDYLEPVMLDANKFGTTGSDIFVFDGEAVSISAFGRSGDDVLFVGSGFTLNEGDTDDGDNAVLEVFFNQRGNNAEIIIETEAYGSDLAAGAGVKVITLTGVNVEDLTFENGIITL
ncbi:DUF4214 domain-containing protein [Telluria beijingensis]|uniref:DUF4214 domain-containing protein n=1 Tax=Telluria beijingensis TaxID=3068633 RepID=UPI002795BB8A|nr:DUF4214 domain-containing protein [Massilia sp. REN29]